jgi:anti-sigma factor RsiW
VRRRYEREIEELLAQMEDFLPEEPPPRRRARITLWFDNCGEAFSAWWRRLSAQQLMLTSFLLVVVAFFLRFFTPTAAYFLGISGAFLFVFAFALSFLKGGASPEKRWRGQVIELPRKGDWWGRWLAHWLRRRAR